MTSACCCRTKLILPLVLLFVLVPAALSQDAARPLVDKASEVALEEMKKQGIAGLQIAIVIDKKIVVSQGFGFADLENGVAMRPATLVRTGSIAKPITAVAAMQLHQAGKLDLDAPVQRYCAAFPEKQWAVTTRQLLGHLGGVRHYKQDYSDFFSMKHYARLTDGFELFANEPVTLQPGTKYLYTTHGYTVVGCVIEGVIGKDIGTALKELVTAPLGMTSTRVDDVFEIIPGRSRPYSHAKDGTLQNSTFVDTSNKIPGGGLISTADDLARLAIALQSNTLLTPETTNLMWTSQRTTDGQLTGYGCGWNVRDENGLKVIEHGGSQPGASTVLWMAPEKGFAIAIMANTDQVNVRRIAQALAATYLQPQGLAAAK